MAEEGGGLLVEIGVTQARMERELAKVLKQAGATADRMEKDFKRANDNIGKGAGNAFNGITRGASAAAPAVRDLSGYTGTLASQLNDIAVQLAGGQSPFQIMLQQGTQIGQIAQQAGGGLKGLGSILAGAFTSVLSPVNLLTFAVIGLSGYAIQYFSDIVSGGDASNRTLEEQRKLLESVAQKWGEAVPALQAYVDQLERAKNAQDLVAATDIAAKAQYEPVTAQLQDLTAAYGDLISQLNQSGAEPEVVNNLTTAFDNLREKMDAGMATQADFKAVQDALAAAVANSGIPAIADFAAQFDVLSSSIATAAANARKARADLQAITGQYPSHGARPIDPLLSGADMTIQGTSDPALPETGPTPTQKPSPLDQYPGGGFTKTRGGGGGRGANAYKDEVAQIKERTAALQASTAAQAAINPLVSDYGFAMEKAKAEAQLLADAQRAGMTITPQLKEQISALAGGYAQASADAKRLAESQDEIKKRAQEWASLEKSVFSGFIKDLRDGKSGAEALSNALQKVADKLLDMALDDIFSTKSSSSGGGGFFGSLLGGIGKLFGFASGTPNTGGRRGEPAGVVHGQEAVIPLPSGGKVPVQISTPTVPSAGASRDEVTIHLIDDSGRMADIADQRIQTHSGTIVRVAVGQSYKQVKQNMPGLMTDAQQRAL